MYPKVLYFSNEMYNRHNTSTVLVNTNWRNMSIYANKLREIDINIHKATINKTNSVLHINDNSEHYISYEKQSYIQKCLQNINTDIINSNSSINIRLDPYTKIKIYNVPYQNLTTLEFSCKDRVGLLADLCEMLTYFPYEISKADINTVNTTAYNTILLEKDSHSLDTKDIQFITNVFEYEIKRTKYIKDESY